MIKSKNCWPGQKLHMSKRDGLELLCHSPLQTKWLHSCRVMGIVFLVFFKYTFNASKLKKHKKKVYVRTGLQSLNADANVAAPTTKPSQSPGRGGVVLTEEGQSEASSNQTDDSFYNHQQWCNVNVINSHVKFMQETAVITYSWDHHSAGSCVFVCSLCL